MKLYRVDGSFSIYVLIEDPKNPNQDRIEAINRAKLHLREAPPPLTAELVTDNLIGRQP